MRIYIIQGQTGEYSDHTEWLVEAHTSEARAKLHVQELETKVLELKVMYETNGFVDYEARSKAKTEMEQFDPNFQCAYTGTQYTYIECELLVSDMESTK